MKLISKDLDFISVANELHQRNLKHEEKLNGLIETWRQKTGLAQEQAIKEIIKMIEENLDRKKSFKSNAIKLSFINSFVQNIHQKRLSDSKYTELEAIVDKIQELESKYKLIEKDFEKQQEYQEYYNHLNNEYEILFEKREEEAFHECLSPETIQYISKNKKEYEKACKLGKKLISEDKEKRKSKNDNILSVIKIYEKESILCAENGAYHAACIMKGAATEALLLHKIKQCFHEDNLQNAITNINQQRTKNKITSSTISKLGLQDLIKIAEGMNWFTVQYNENVIDIKEWNYYIKEIRNLVHPGKFAKAIEHINVSKHSYSIISKVYRILKHNIKLIKKT